MPELPSDILRLAEDLNAHLPARPGDVRVDCERYVMTLAPGLDPHLNVVQQLRLLPEDVAAVVTEVRVLLRAHGRTSATWEVGPSAQPDDLADRLMALGMTPDQPEPITTGMVLVGAPPSPAPSRVTVRQVESAEDFRASSALFNSCFGQEGEPEDDFARYHDCNTWLRFLAWTEGRAVAAADTTLTPTGVVLTGGATLPQARGQGAYRALVWARWQLALARGTPFLITQASSMSRPILARLGFTEVAQIRVFLDRFGDT